MGFYCRSKSSAKCYMLVYERAFKVKDLKW